MDPFDDFEFKPLTEGLGFHKKAEKSKSETTRSTRLDDDFIAPVSRSPERPFSLNTEAESDLLGRDIGHQPPRQSSKSITDLINSLPPSLDFMDDDLDLNPKRPEPPSPPPVMAKTAATPTERPQIFQPLAPREDYGAPATTAISRILKTPLAKPASATTATVPAPTMPTLPKPSAPLPAYRERLDESFAKAFPRSERTSETSKSMATDVGGFQPIPAHFGAAIVDTMVVTGMSTVLMVLIVLITRVNLWGMLTSSQTDVPTQIHMALLFVAVLNLYLLTARSFFKASLGEWAFELQLGTDDDQKRHVYPLLVAWRTIAMTLTGLILIPLLSFVFGRDLAKPITGLQLFRRP